MATPENKDVRLIADLTRDLQAEYDGKYEGLRVYQNEVFAQVFEIPEHRRMQVWDEANFMGGVDGYSWQEQLWSGTQWVDVTDVSTQADLPLLDEDELRVHLSAFLEEADALRPENLTPTEASLDRLARRALGEAAIFARIVGEMDHTVKTLESRMDEKDKMLNQTRAALINLIQPAPSRPQTTDRQVDQTGPVIETTYTETSGPDLG